MRIVIKSSSAEKIFRYFFGNTWQEFPVIELAVRHKKINLFDDELYVWNKTLNGYKTFNWNADPSAFRIGIDAIAILRTGVHFYKISYHHIGDNSKRYIALRPATPNEELPVMRTDKNGNRYLSIGRAINQHAGGDRTTGSRGCQTAPRPQYPEFITFIGAGFGIKIPLGIQKKPEKRFLDGIGKIPYILLTQAQFDYIVNLPESEFDSADDLRFQQTNFVGIPKLDNSLPQISDKSAVAARVIANLEAEDFSNLSDDELDSAVVPVENSASEDDPAVSFGIPFSIPQIPVINEQSPSFWTEKLQELPSNVSEKVKETKETAEGVIERTLEASKEIFVPKNLPAFIPRFGKQWLLSFLPGAGFLATFGTWLLNAPVWIQIAMAAAALVALWKILELVIAHREKVLDFIKNCYLTTADPEMDNLIPTDAGGFIGKRKNALLSAAAPPKEINTVEEEK